MTYGTHDTPGADQGIPTCHDRVGLPSEDRADFKDVQTLCGLHGLHLERAEGFVLTRCGKPIYVPTLRDVLNAVESLRSLDV